MSEYWTDFAVEVLPGVALIIVGALAATPAYKILRHHRRGRACSAIGYLAGFALGVWTTVLLTVIVGAVEEPGLVAAFVGPFVGMARAKWELPQRRPRKLQASTQ